MTNTLEEVKMSIQQSFEEFNRGVRENDPKLIKKALKETWLNLVKAIDVLLLAKGFKEDEIKTHKQKRLALDKLSLRDSVVEKLRDEFIAREYNLYIRGVCEGEYDIEVLRKEIKKAKDLVEAISFIFHN